MQIFKEPFDVDGFPLQYRVLMLAKKKKEAAAEGYYDFKTEAAYDKYMAESLEKEPKRDDWINEDAQRIIKVMLALQQGKVPENQGNPFMAEAGLLEAAQLVRLLEVIGTAEVVIPNGKFTQYSLAYKAPDQF